jgi:hypothetical protein
MDQEEASTRWNYEPETGLIRWRIRTYGRGGVINPGDVAGTTNVVGYVVVNRLGKLYTAHRLAWLMMTGRWPTEIDHVNGNRTDNRWTNLREVTRTQNNLNRRVRGYTLSRGGKFVAQLKVNRVKRYLGTFDTAEEARAAHAAARAAAF